MNRYDCEAIRDLLPSLTRGEMLPHEAAPAELHLEGCAECRAQRAIVRLLQTTIAPVPPGLESRVIAVVHRRAARRGSPARLALAATLAAAVLGGAFVYDRLGRDRVDVDAVSWAAARDPLLHGDSELHDLSVEELEMLLEEMDR
ncbi:MAG: zf-HC2 domain-containing protein [Longimicrobiales bacterium]